MAVTGTIFDIKRYAIHDGPGIRTTIFFKGCPLDCAWCHNPESRSSEPEPAAVRRVSGIGTGESAVTGTVGCTVSDDAVMKEIMADEIFYDQSGGGVTFSGGEPMMQIDFLASLLGKSHTAIIHTAVDTCGYAPWEDFERIHDEVDLFLFDLKPMDNRLHEQYTGYSNTLIHDNLKMLAQSTAEVIVRIPLIPGVSATGENINAVADFLDPMTSLRRIDLLPYNRLGEDKIRRYKLKRTWHTRDELSEEDITGFRKRLESRGFDVRIEG